MTQRPRVCLRCQGRIGWEKRRDALYCSNSCKQAAYHERAGLPIERWRVLIGSVGWTSGLDDLPSDDWGAQVFVVAYSRTTQCKLCDYPIEHDEAPDEDALTERFDLDELEGAGIVLARRTGGLGPFCSYECLLEAAHTVEQIDAQRHP